MVSYCPPSWYHHAPLAEWTPGSSESFFRSNRSSLLNLSSCLFPSGQRPFARENKRKWNVSMICDPLN